MFLAPCGKTSYRCTRIWTMDKIINFCQPYGKASWPISLESSWTCEHENKLAVSHWSPLNVILLQCLVFFMAMLADKFSHHMCEWLSWTHSWVSFMARLADPFPQKVGERVSMNINLPHCLSASLPISSIFYHCTHCPAVWMSRHDGFLLKNILME